MALELNFQCLLLMWFAKAGFCHEEFYGNGLPTTKTTFYPLHNSTTTSPMKLHNSLKPRSLFGEPCNTTLKCKGGSWLACDPATSLCACTKPNEMTWNQASSKCVVAVGESCKFGIVGAEGDQNGLFEIADCVPNAYCNATMEKGMCTCQSTHYVDEEGTKCSEKKGFGSSCALKDECSDARLLSCGTNSTCQCEKLEEMVLDPASGTCKIKIGSSCLGQVDHCVNNASCFIGYASSVCHCPLGFYESEEGLQCSLVKSKGSPCTSDVECDTKERLSCVQGRCSCNPQISVENSKPFLVSVGNAAHSWNVEPGFCLAKVGQPCTLNRKGREHYYTQKPLPDEIYCVQDSRCRGFVLGSCECEKGKYETSNKLCGKGHGSPCSSSDLCSDMLICTDEGNQMKCQCRNPDLQIYDSAVKQCRSKVGASCNPNMKHPCVRNASCRPVQESLHRCECNEGLVEGMDQQCYIGHGQPCTQGGSSVTLDNCDPIPGLRCYLDSDGTSTCRCRNEEQVYERDLRKCSHDVGFSCKKNTDCVSQAWCRPPDAMSGPRCVCNKGMQKTDIHVACKEATGIDNISSPV